MATPASLAGRMLIAMPGIGDPRFERAVILICAHNDEHAMGLAVNRPVDGLTVPSLLSRLGVESTISLPDDYVLFGGPVERERGFVLHTDDYSTPQSTVEVAEGIGLTATREVLEAMGDSETRPRKSVLALGYAGWDGGQLERRAGAQCLAHLRRRRGPRLRRRPRTDKWGIAPLAKIWRPSRTPVDLDRAGLNRRGENLDPQPLAPAPECGQAPDHFDWRSNGGRPLEGIRRARPGRWRPRSRADHKASGLPGHSRPLRM